MKDTTYVIAETARRTGIKEEIVERVLRIFNDDLSDFINEKQGYNIPIPKVGRLSFRVQAIDTYIEAQRRYKRFWEHRLEVGLQNKNNRTILASESNIQLTEYNITQVLKIREDYLLNHAPYDKKRAVYFAKTSKADPSRILEYLDVSDVTLSQAALNSTPKEYVFKVPKSLPRNTFSTEKVQDVLAYLQGMQMPDQSQNSQHGQPVPDISVDGNNPSNA